MPRFFKNDADLFAETSMTFGEHLDELRTCLWRSLMGLLVGAVFGLLIGGRVVHWIQAPLSEALVEYYMKQTEKDVDKHVDELRAVGYPDNLVEQVQERKLVPERVFVKRDELLMQLQIGDYVKDLDGIVTVPEVEADDNTPLSLNDVYAWFSAVRTEPAEEPPALELVTLYFWRDITTDARVRATSLNAHEAFMIYLKASIVVGFMLASPWIFYQVWSFVAAGLYSHEKKYIHLFLPISLGLFFAGAAMAYFFVFDYVLKFLFMFNSSLGIDPDPRISEWMGFVIMLPLGFGIAFQLPLVMLFLERIGIFSIEAYLKQWRVSTLVIFVISMFLTPADPQSMFLMAAPLCVLYFVGILMCKFMPRRKSPYADASNS